VIFNPEPKSRGFADLESKKNIAKRMCLRVPGIKNPALRAYGKKSERAAVSWRKTSTIGFTIPK